jgi:hypothetical protein
MKVIWQKGPGINPKTTFFRKESKFGKTIVSILIGHQDRPFLDASTLDMMEGDQERLNVLIETWNQFNPYPPCCHESVSRPLRSDHLKITVTEL